MRRRPAPAKINLALVVGPRRDDGKHEVVTVLQAVDLADRITVEPAARLRVTGFAEDTLVRRALELLSQRAGETPGLDVRIEKRIPVASGLGGGSSDAATALRLANEMLEQPLAPLELERVGSELGTDVPFFLRVGPQLGEEDGSRLTPLDLPQDYWVVLLLPHGARKASTASVYRDFAARQGGEGFDERRERLRAALASVRRPRDLGALPPNDLASSPFAARLLELGAFRAGVSGAGPAVYGLFAHRTVAEAATRCLEPLGRSWLTVPAWYV